MNMARCAFSAVAVFAILACDSAAAQAYKWVDENGRTHFSDTPPPDRKTDKVTIQPLSPATPRGVAGGGNWQAQLQESNARRAQQQAQQEAEDRDRRAMERNCSIARGESNSLQRGRIFRYDQNGERQYLEDSERPAALAAAQKRVERYCR
jgi:hypothetical protein